MSPPTRFGLRLVFFCLLLAGLSLPGRALIIFGSPAGHTADPGTGLPWDHVGLLNGASGVYLGSFTTGYWVATANHVGTGNITLDGLTYNFVPGSGVQIGATDLHLFRIDTPAPLPNLNLANSTPAVGTSVWMIGNGGGKSWGTNTIETTGAAGAPTNGLALLTDYDSVSGEAQGTGGDSGGATFYMSGGDWILAGISSAVSVSGPPFYTVSIDVGAYSSQIFALTGAAAAIPEPGSTTLLAAATVLGLAVRMRRRRRCHLP